MHDARAHDTARPVQDTAEARLARARAVLETWAGKQGHDRCWYYPDLFNELIEILGANASTERGLPPRHEFERGCVRYQQEEYGRADSEHECEQTRK